MHGCPRYDGFGDSEEVDNGANVGGVGQGITDYGWTVVNHNRRATIHHLRLRGANLVPMCDGHSVAYI